MNIMISNYIIHNKSHEIRYYYRYDCFLCVDCKIWLDPCSCKPEDECPFEKPPIGGPEDTDKWEKGIYG